MNPEASLAVKELHFLLLAPLSRLQSTPPDSRGPRSVFVDRHTTREIALNQTWQTLSPQSRYEDVGPLPSRVTKAAQVRVRGQHILALETTLWSRTDADPRANSEIERTLTVTAQNFVRRENMGAEPPWVGRYQLLQRGEEVLPDWLTEEHEEFRLSTPTPATLRIGWGNGVIAGWESLAPIDQQEVVRGFVDAQCIWYEADGIAHRSITLLRSLGAVHDRVTSGDLGEAQRTLDALHYTYTEHHIAYDDVALNLQGPRRAVAESALAAWGYRGLCERIGRRIEDCKEVIVLRQSRRERRYQSTVEKILFLLGLITFVDVVLNLVSTAFSETSGGMPGAGSSIGILSAVRSADADILLLATLAVALMTFMGVEYGRRRWGMR